MEREESLLNSIKNLEDCIRNVLISGIMEQDDDVVLLNTMNNKLRSLKTEYVDKCHVTEDGTPRRISELTTGGKHFFVTYCAGKKKIKSTTLDGLYDKLYQIYALGDKNYYSFENIFNLAIEDKKRQKGVADENTSATASKHNTIYKNEHDYMRYIFEPFAKMDIRQMTPLIVKDYTISMLNKVNSKMGYKLPKKGFQSYKGILNIAFNYADEHDICPNFISNPNKFKDKDYSDLYDSSKKPAEKKAFSKEQIDNMSAEIDSRIPKTVQYSDCYTNGYMFKLSKLTGMRCAELCSLMKTDISFEMNYIHVHSQQLKKDGTQEYEYVPYTKDEKGSSKGGRYVPLLPEAKEMLIEMFKRQEELGIESEYVFANLDGSWIKSDTHYQKFLQRLSRKFGYEISNNHAIRMYFNSYVLIPAGVEVADRARILGHSPEVNLKFYTFESRDYCENAYNSICSYME